MLPTPDQLRQRLEQFDQQEALRRSIPELPLPVFPLKLKIVRT